MNLQRIRCPQATRFAASMSDARTTRETLMEEFGLRKAAITIQPFEISTKKPDLIAVLNNLAALGDAIYAANTGDGKDE